MEYHSRISRLAVRQSFSYSFNIYSFAGFTGFDIFEKIKKKKSFKILCTSQLRQKHRYT